MHGLTDFNHWYGEDITPRENSFRQGLALLKEHRLFNALKGTLHFEAGKCGGKEGMAVVDKHGNIYVNTAVYGEPKEWAHVLAHCLLHLAFGHFDAAKIPTDPKGRFDPILWNHACDIYITRFLADISFGRSPVNDPAEEYAIRLNDEKKICEYLRSRETAPELRYGTNGNRPDMLGAEHPIRYKNGQRNLFAEQFSFALRSSVSRAVQIAGGHDDPRKEPVTAAAANWFLTHYPLLGGVASSLRIVEDITLCHRFQIRIAAVDVREGKIYANPSAGLDEEEWKFVLAHEYLHAGLDHPGRCRGRDPYLRNVACDYVINDWLCEMNIGKVPKIGILFDPDFHGHSAEEIYDIIVMQMRKFRKHATFRGYDKGDLLKGSLEGFRPDAAFSGISADEYFKNALREGLDFHRANHRGLLPAGLIAEIKALSAPPIPWEAELGKWFDQRFPLPKKRRSYARPSRRQNATPEIPRPRVVSSGDPKENRTFGVIIDTSGSMSYRNIALALGAAASYAAAKEVPAVRVVFCDAEAYDAGYLTPEDIAGKVRVRGGGGTALQPAVRLLENAKDFPKDAPLLIITDGAVEKNLKIKRDHAFLLPKGRKLPFTPQGKTFHFKKRT